MHEVPCVGLTPRRSVQGFSSCVVALVQAVVAWPQGSTEEQGNLHPGQAKRLARSHATHCPCKWQWQSSSVPGLM